MPVITGVVSEDGHQFYSEAKEIKLYASGIAEQVDRLVNLSAYAGKEIAAVYQHASGDGSDLYGVRKIGILEDVDSHS